MAKSFPTVDEVISTLKKSNLPTLISEGRDDYIVFRHLEGLLGGCIDILPVGGRENVLQVFRRKIEIGHDRVAFIVDRDLWCFTDPPDEFAGNDIVITDGYSIENDVFRDIDVPSLMAPDERVKYLIELQKIARWYALAVSRIMAGEGARIDIHPTQLLDVASTFDAMTALVAGEDYPDRLYQQISSDIERLLRGKTLLQTAMRQLARIGRPARYHHHALLDQAGVRRGPLLEKIANEVERILTPAT